LRSLYVARWLLAPLCLLSGLLACSSHNSNVHVQRLPDGRLQVKGPRAGPFKTLEELAENTCTLMTSQPGATNGAYGFEYCALHYHSAADGAYFLSYLSDVGGGKAGRRRYCELPSVLDDSTHPDAIILGGAHTHPHNRKFSPEDLSVRAHWYPTRFFDQRTQRVLDRQLLLFFREVTGECRAYAYNNATRTVAALREGRWVPIGKVYDDDGNIQMLEGQDWLP
jgi:hypothetical protein